MNILVIGDIFGKPGRTALKELLPGIIKKEQIDFVIANIENASGGRGLAVKAANELLKLPIDVMTAGNHIWEFEQIFAYLDSKDILRPYNVKGKQPGKGWAQYECNGLTIVVISLQGEIFMDEKGKKVESPFKAIDDALHRVIPTSDIIIVDLHAEATSEKRAFAWYVDGRVQAVLGTHTHVQTADEEILPGGTAYISDLGMTGPHASVIGLRKEEAIHRFLTGDKKKFKVAKEGVRLEGVILSVCEKEKSVQEIKRLKVLFEGEQGK